MCEGPKWDRLLACSWMQSFEVGQVRTGRLTHPSGARAEFEFRPTRHGRTNVPFDCIDVSGGGGANNSGAFNWHPVFSDVWALVRKTVRGPGLVDSTWAYGYPSPKGSYAPDRGSQTRIVTLTHPDGSLTQSAFGTAFEVTEGQLLWTRELTSIGSELSRTDITYVSNAEAAVAPFPSQVGSSPRWRGEFFSATTQRPEKQRIVRRQGATFTWKVVASPTDFDLHANPSRMQRTSSLGYSKTEQIVYSHNTSRWVLSQVASVRDVETGLYPEQTSYSSTTALPSSRRSFGQLVESLTWNTDGSLASVTDGNGRSIAFSLWYRGVPRRISFADGSIRQAVVNNLGQITSTTDELGFTHSYGYDAMGRLNQVTYPTGDSTAWAQSQFSFVPVATTEHGLGPGHWRRTETTGNYRKQTWFDARWRPVLELEEDTANSATRRYTARCYNHEGRETFTGYATTSFGTFSPTSTCNGAGIRTDYDALGRTTRTQQSSELGTLTTTIAYESGFRTRTTSPRAQVSITQYQAFDQPDTSAPVQIDEPEGVRTVIVRDDFGKPLRITRSGSWGGAPIAATRDYVYDSAQRLCKRIEPERGATVYDYDAAGNLRWRAEGSSLSSLFCDRSSVPVAQRIQHSYDARNRLTRIDYPGTTTPAEIRTYYSDGALKTLTHGASEWRYFYNKRRLMTEETLYYNSAPYRHSYAYNALGHRASLTTPNNLNISFAPNALGQPTRAGSFASNASYFPDGTLKQFSYGNGLVRTVTQNARKLPSRVRDALGSQVAHDFGYSYDAHANVMAITDFEPGGLQSRSLGYDGRDRLISATDPNLWGSASFAYDPLDKLRAFDQFR